MSQLVYGDRRVDQWVASNLGLRPWADSFSIANTKENRILGASVLHNWFPEAGVVEISSFGEHPSWMSRKMINAVFSYAFEHLKCQMIVLRVAEDNDRMLNIGSGLGFKSYTIPRLRGRNVNEVIMTLTDDDWLKSRYRSN